jgi:hypothetical protein
MPSVYLAYGHGPVAVYSFISSQPTNHHHCMGNGVFQHIEAHDWVEQ